MLRWRAIVLFLGVLSAKRGMGDFCDLYIIHGFSILGWSVLHPTACIKRKQKETREETGSFPVFRDLGDFLVFLYIFYIPPIYRSIVSHSVLPVDRRYRICDWKNISKVNNHG